MDKGYLINLALDLMLFANKNLLMGKYLFTIPNSAILEHLIQVYQNVQIMLSSNHIVAEQILLHHTTYSILTVQTANLNLMHGFHNLP